MPRAVARLSLLDGRPSSRRGQPSSPTMSSFVRFVTPGLGVPPHFRTTSNASARLMQASRPVKATEFSSAELFGSTGIMICPPKGSDSLLARPLFGRSTRLGTRGWSFLFLGIDTGPKGVHEIDHLWLRTFFDRLDLFPSFFLFEQINQRVLISILELGRIEVAS